MVLGVAGCTQLASLGFGRQTGPGRVRVLVRLTTAPQLIHRRLSKTVALALPRVFKESFTLQHATGMHAQIEDKIGRFF